MNPKEFVNYLEKDSETYEVQETEMNNKRGIVVNNRIYDTRTFFTNEAIEENDISHLLKATHQGRNLETITRVTGFFSKTRGWNKGKTGELKQRSRTNVHNLDN